MIDSDTSFDTDEPEQVIEPDEVPTPPEPQDEPVYGFDGDEGADGDGDQDGGSTVIRTLREKTREQARRIKELEERTNAAVQDKGQSPKPTMESCGWDEEAFECELDAWKSKQSEIQRKADADAKAARDAQEAWANRVLTFERKAKELMPNFDDVVQSVADHFGDDQAGMAARAILIYANDPRLVAALKNSPSKLAELVAIKNDPTALAIAVGELKGKLRTMSRRSAPPPEIITKGGAPASPDKELDRLEKEAERSGDRTAVQAYKRRMKAA